MKAFAGITLVFFAAAAVAQPEQPVTTDATRTVAQEASPGSIIMYRGSSIMGAAIACPIRYKGREIVELGRGKFAQWAVPAGRYILGNGTASVEVGVMPGETRYVRCQIKTGFLTGRADLQIVDEESFVAHRASYEEKPVASPF